MLPQILAKTPLYVWAILAFLVYRGVVAARDRDMTATRMLVIPLAMLALSLQGMATKFGASPVAWSAWLLGAGALMLQRWTSSGERISAGSVAGSVRVRGSWAPLVLMLIIFLVNYTVAVALAIRPHLAAHAVFAATACGLFGASSGYFLGQLARDLGAWRRMLSLHPDASELGTT